MTTYFLRRFLQMGLVVLLSAAASYAILNFAPGGPLAGKRNCIQGQKGCPTPDELQRIRSYFELDLDASVRFSRWLIGQPRGPHHYVTPLPGAQPCGGQAGKLGDFVNFVGAFGVHVLVNLTSGGVAVKCCSR